MINIFRNIFSKPIKRKRLDENIEGDFYTEYGVCTACGAPQAEAPDLIDHSEKEYGHCFFKKQPQTDEELDRAISALQVSCVSGIRYGGKNEKILKRLYEMGSAGECDYKPVGKYKTIIWDTVTFKFDGSLTELMIMIKDGITASRPWINKTILDRESYETSSTFVLRWANIQPGVIYRCTINSEEVKIKLNNETHGQPLTLRYHAMDLNLILQLDKRVSKIKWFDMDKKTHAGADIYRCLNT